jgi:hypothetical protein
MVANYIHDPGHADRRREPRPLHALVHNLLAGETGDDVRTDIRTHRGAVAGDAAMIIETVQTGVSASRSPSPRLPDRGVLAAASGPDQADAGRRVVALIWSRCCSWSSW